jgi:hypothetical protein
VPREIVGLTLFETGAPGLWGDEELFAECLARPGVPIHAELRMRHKDAPAVTRGHRHNRLDGPQG